MAEIVLTTLNARYIHAAFGLRYLLANLGELRGSARIMEFDVKQRPLDIAEAVLAESPRIVGIGLYIWNAAPAAEVAALLKRLQPGICLVLGGPEISFETDEQPIAATADYVITGEADLRFAQLCREILAGKNGGPKIIPAPLPEFSGLALPYDLYDERDIAHRVIYVEASRGCPFSCEFCLSSLDIPVRQASLPSFLEQIGRLLARGARQLKFVDRTFNLDARLGRQILEFLLERWKPGRFFHFEMMPDHLPDTLREVIARFPQGALQFELGIQTFNPVVAERISRRQNYERLANNLVLLRRETGVHLHADLIAGLPGETLESFAAGFDRLLALGPHEIQVGILKRLRGTPIVRHDKEWQMTYSPHPPYEILCNKQIDFTTMQKLRRFARHWDLVGNSGNFVSTAPLLWNGSADTHPRKDSPTARSSLSFPESPFASFMQWSEWLYRHTHRTDGIALARLMELLFRYLVEERKLAPGVVAQALWTDYRRGGRRDKPAFLAGHLPKTDAPAPTTHQESHGLPKRQARHHFGPP